MVLFTVYFGFSTSGENSRIQFSLVHLQILKLLWFLRVSNFILLGWQSTDLTGGTTFVDKRWKLKLYLI